MALGSSLKPFDGVRFSRFSRLKIAEPLAFFSDFLALSTTILQTAPPGGHV